MPAEKDQDSLLSRRFVNWFLYFFEIVSKSDWNQGIERKNGNFAYD